jgi:PAS domain S-box-containing protein
MPPSSNIVRLPSVPALSWDDCRLLVESVVDYAIFMLDVDGHVATWNLGAEKIKGYKADEIVGAHFSKFFPPEDVASGKPERELQIATELGRFEDESWRVRKNGTRFWANVVITALRDETGKLRGFGKVTRDLSERRRTEEELRRSEERFRLLVESVSDYAIYMLDPTGRITTWNLGAERMKGYRPSEIIGQHFERFFPEEDVASGKPSRALAKARALGRFEDEGWRVRRDGSRFWVNAILTALYDSHGTLVGFAKVTQDLTVRREAEEKGRTLLREQTAREVAEREGAKVRASEERYRALSRRLEIVLEGVTDGITAQDPLGRIVFANTAAARICGFSSADEMVRTPPAELVKRFDLFDINGRPFRVEELPARRVLAGEESASAVLHVRELATQWDWWVQIRAGAVLGDDGKPSLAISIWHDVTAARRQEVQSKYLAEATSALGRSLVYDEMLTTLARALIPGLADWCSIYLLEGGRLRDVTVAHVNPEKQMAAQRYRQKFPPDPAHAGGVWGVIRSGAAEVFNDITAEKLKRSTTDPEALELLRSLGMTAALLAPIRARDRVLGVIALVYAQPGRRFDPSDVTLVEELGRRAGVALENAQLYQAAQEAAKIAAESAKQAEEAARAAEEASRAKDEFLATVSHELRTPLNAILGWSSLLKDRITDAATAKPIEVIYRNAQAQAKIIEDILDVSRVITGKFHLDPRPTDLIVIARDSIEVVRPSAEAKRIRIEFTPCADTCVLVVDPVRIQQVVWNLLSNAVKFTEPGGSLQLSIQQDGAQVVLTVADTGQGIDPAFLPYVFDRFKQADASMTRRVGGLGLGLALVRHIVELHGGRVEAASEGVGRGSTITVTLPIRVVTPLSEG